MLLERNTEHPTSSGGRYTLGKAACVELGSLLSQTNDEGERASRGRAGGISAPRVPRSPPSLPASLPPAATFARGATAASAPGRAPAPAALRAALPGENTCCRSGCFSAFRWLFRFPPCSAPTGVTAAPAARAETPLPSFHRGTRRFPPGPGPGAGPRAGSRASSGARRARHRDSPDSSGAPGRGTQR